jgi:hypothetical protein
MRSFVATAVAVAFCFAFVFPLRSAAAQKIINGTVNCNGKVEQLPNGLYGCTKPLPLQPPGGVNPNDYAMCGVLIVSGLPTPLGQSNPTIEARFIIADGQYAAQLGISYGSPPDLKFTCVHFTAFTGPPPVSDARVSISPPVSNSNMDVGSAADACIWAGFIGSLDAVTGAPTVVRGQASAMYVGAKTEIQAYGATSYAFCYGYTASWKGWQYAINGVHYHNSPGTTNVHENRNWCYMDGIQTQTDQQNAKHLPKTFDAGLKISSGVYGTTGIYAIGDSSVGMGYNCLSFNQ